MERGGSERPPENDENTQRRRTAAPADPDDAGRIWCASRNRDVAGRIGRRTDTVRGAWTLSMEASARAVERTRRSAWNWKYLVGPEVSHGPEEKIPK
eukprot:5068305-Prymnesium_polylepis.1